MNASLAACIILLLQLAYRVHGQDPKTATFEVKMTPYAAVSFLFQLGESRVFSCSVSVTGDQDQTPVIKWFINDVEVTDTAPPARVLMESREDSQMLRLNDIQDDDGGIYKCEATLAGQADSKFITVEVTEPLKLHSPLDQFGILGSNGEVKCEVTGKPAPSIVWKFENGTNIPNTAKHVIRPGMLEIIGLTFDDDQVYYCDIVVPQTGDTMPTYIKYEVFVPPVVDELENVDDAVEGGYVKVRCTARGDPAPSIKWTKVTDDGGLDDGFGSDGPKFETVGDSAADAEIKVVGKNMIFNPVKYQDAGTYQCTAFNVVGNVTKTLTLHVKYKPTFDTDYKERKFYGWEGHRVNMTCQVKANELALIEWHHPNEAEPNNFNKTTAISNDQIYTVETQQNFPEYHLSSASLLVRIGLDDTADINVYKNYVCRAVNLQGKSYQVVSLVEAKVPGQPQVIVVNTLSTMVTVQIEPPRQEISQPITSYTYSYHPDGNTAQKEQATVVTEGTGAITTVELRNLEPSTSYVLRVSAENVVGPGSERSLTIATKAVSSPLRMNIVSQQEGDAANSYLLRWQDPYDGGSPITHFIIKYKEVDVVGGDEPVEWIITGDVDAQFTEATEANPKSLSYRLSNLDSDSFYLVLIQAVNSLGSSGEAYILIKTSKGGSFQYVNPTTTPAPTGIKLTSSTDVIEPALTRDFYIMCSYPKPADLGLATIMSMVISKGESDTNFKEIASVNLAQPLHVAELASVGAKITGKLDPQDMTYIRLDWAFPSENATGVYVCEANGHNALGHAVLSKTSLRVTSKSPNMQSLVNQFRIFKKQQEVFITSMMDKLRKQNVTNQELLNRSRTQKVTINNMKDQLRKQNVTDQELLNRIGTQKVTITDLKDQLQEQNVTDQELLNKIRTQKVTITNMKDQLREQNVTITNMKDQLQEQNVTDQELLNRIGTQKVTITNMKDQLQEQNVVANITSLRHRVLKLENYVLRDLFNVSAVSAGKQYLVSRIGNVNINKAEALCNAAGGHLAEIRSSAELDVIKKFMQTLSSTNSQFIRSYFSPTQENHLGRWVYRHSGEDMTYTEIWGSGYPDSTGDACALLDHSTWKARNYRCGGYSRYNFICERAAAP